MLIVCMCLICVCVYVCFVRVCMYTCVYYACAYMALYAFVCIHMCSIQIKWMKIVVHSEFVKTTILYHFVL